MSQETELNKTYFKHDAENGGSLELDLCTFREKGVEQRYLLLVVNAVDLEKTPPTSQKITFSIDSKEQFEALKQFFTQLKWED